MSRFYARGRVEKELQVRYDDEETVDNASPETQDIDGENRSQKDTSLSKDYINVPSRPYILKILNKQGKTEALCLIFGNINLIFCVSKSDLEEFMT